MRAIQGDMIIPQQAQFFAIVNDVTHEVGRVMVAGQHKDGRFETQQPFARGVAICRFGVGAEVASVQREINGEGQAVDALQQHIRAVHGMWRPGWRPGRAEGWIGADVRIADVDKCEHGGVSLRRWRWD